MAVVEHLLIGLGYAPNSASRPLVKLSDAGAVDGVATVAEEVPIALVYNGRSHAVVMGTPSDLEDLAYGFSLTEGIVDNVTQIEHLAIVRASHGIELQIQIPGEKADRLEDRARGLVARTGCGLCGVETINEALRVPVQVPHAFTVNSEALWRAGAELAGQQALNNETSTVHAAAWSSASGVLIVVREDVGRHNALDKVLGALARNGTPIDNGFIVVTSRASYEMVQKTATCGIELLAAISRPTGLAIRFAEAAGITLVGLLRARTANVYCGSERIESSGPGGSS